MLKIVSSDEQKQDKGQITLKIVTVPAQTTYGLELEPHGGEEKDEGKVLGEGGLEFFHDLLSGLAWVAAAAKKILSRRALP
jgi:hypothetical protein